MLFTAYLDESGTHNDSDALSVAGYISTCGRWLAFDEEWRAALKEYGIPFFRMNKFSNGVEPYKSWSPDEKKARLTRLVGIVHEYAIASVGVVIPLKAFHAIVSDKAKRVSGGPYGLAAHRMFLEAADVVKRLRADGWIRYVFAEGAHGAGVISNTYNRQEPVPFNDMLRRAGLGFENAQVTPPLQAADILAYELYRHLPKTLGIDSHGPRENYQRLKELPRKWVRFDEGDLDFWSQLLSHDRFPESVAQPKARTQRRKK